MIAPSPGMILIIMCEAAAAAQRRSGVFCARPSGFQRNRQKIPSVLHPCCMEQPVGFGNRWKTTRTKCNTCNMKSSQFPSTNFLLSLINNILVGGHGRNRTGVHGFAVLSKTRTNKGLGVKRPQTRCHKSTTYGRFVKRFRCLCGAYSSTRSISLRKTVQLIGPVIIGTLELPRIS